MDVLFDALFLLSKSEADQKLRVPISALIDYKGFRCLAIGLIPISESPKEPTPALGFHGGSYQPVKADQDLKNAFGHVGDVLRLKENEMTVDARQ